MGSEEKDFDIPDFETEQTRQIDELIKLVRARLRVASDRLDQRDASEAFNDGTGRLGKTEND